MGKLRLNRFTIALLGFVVGLCAGIVGHRALTMILNTATASHATEAMRVTSPDGKLDAVLVVDTGGGALGGVFWYVYVVSKGKAVPKDPNKRLFFADELSRGAVVWSKPNLLEIHYDKASIMHFRNISTKEDNGIEYVELRLVPTSEYSLLTSEGGWRPDN